MLKTPLPVTHGLSVLFLYFKRKQVFDPLALVMAATIIDLEPLYYMLIGEALDHQIWHGYALSLTVYPVLISLTVYSVERVFNERLWSTYNSLRLKPTKIRYSMLSIFLSSLIGSFSHILFDMFTHESLPYVIYPLAFGSNPFYIGQFSGIVEVAVVTLASYSLICWVRSNKNEKSLQ
ncbi:DUF4184 family protein [Candidatus Bathyarchaeota archaeon A05DMB-2]|nr:DUF4184 family protein [Candidatus Bathyarchaeota archaeon A05DMB-2]